jgi:hypothetical protein
MQWHIVSCKSLSHPGGRETCSSHQVSSMQEFRHSAELKTQEHMHITIFFHWIIKQLPWSELICHSSHTECLEKNTGVLVIHIYALPNHRVGTFKKFSTKSVKVLVTWIIEKWQHRTMTCWSASKAGVIQSWCRCRKRHSGCCGLQNQTVQGNFGWVYWIDASHVKCIYKWYWQFLERTFTR